MAVDNFGDVYESDIERYCEDIERAKDNNARLINFYSLLYKKFVEIGLYPGCDIYGVNDNYDVTVHRICSVSGVYGIGNIRVMYICDDGFCFYADDINESVFREAAVAGDNARALKLESMGEAPIEISQIEYNILSCFFESGMDRRAAAGKLSYSPSSIDYHLRKIRDRCRLDPKDYNDLIEIMRRCQVVI